MIIVSTPYKFEIGEIISNNKGFRFSYHQQIPDEFCFKIIREATQEEYITQDEMQRYPRSLIEAHLSLEELYFYLVSPD